MRLKSINEEFFVNPVRSRRLPLRNEVLREEIRKYLGNKPDPGKIPNYLWDAETESHSQLLSHSQEFLRKR